MELSPDIKPHVYTQVIFDKGAKTIPWGNWGNLPTNPAGAIRYPGPDHPAVFPTSIPHTQLLLSSGCSHCFSPHLSSLPSLNTFPLLKCLLFFLFRYLYFKIQCMSSFFHRAFCDYSTFSLCHCLNCFSIPPPLICSICFKSCGSTSCGVA